MTQTTNFSSVLVGALPSCLRKGPEQHDNTVEAIFCFESDFPGFSGHFPQAPILPGVVQLMIAAWLAGEREGWKLAQVSRCKFMRQVSPGEDVLVRAVLREEEGVRMAKVDISVNEEPCAKISMSLQYHG